MSFQISKFKLIVFDRRAHGRQIHLKGATLSYKSVRLELFNVQSLEFLTFKVFILNGRLQLSVLNECVSGETEE